MPKNHLISVILLCYNLEKLIGKNLECFMNQTDKEFELVLVDNSSNDNSLKIMENFKASNKEMDIIIFKNDSTKVYDGRKKGFVNSTGRFVMFHDGDDWLELETIEKCKKRLLEKNMPDCLIFSSKSVDGDGKVISEEDMPIDNTVWMKNTLHGFLIKRDIVISAGLPFKDTFFEDFYVSACLKPYIKSSTFLKRPLYNFYTNPISTTAMAKKQANTKWPELMNDLFSLTKRVGETLESEWEIMIYEYQLIRHYYSIIFAACAYLKYEDKIKTYKEINKVMKKHAPNYLGNKNIAFLKRNYHCGSFKRRIWLSSKLEKLDKISNSNFFMGILIKIYHLALKTSIYQLKH